MEEINEIDDEDAVAMDHPLLAELKDSRGSGAANLEVVAKSPPSYPLTSSPQLASEMYETSRKHFSDDGLSEDWLMLGFADRASYLRSVKDASEAKDKIDEEQGQKT